MAKKLLCVIVLMLALVCVLASCGHEHEWGQWQTNKEATCTTEGSQIRYCVDEDCQESETSTISAKGHSFGEWVTSKEATCTENGSKERICACGEKETETIYSSGHNFANYGICLDCNYGWVTINLPETPLTIRSYSSYFEISGLRYELGRYDSGYLFRLFYSGTKKSGASNTYVWMNIKLVDSEGYVVFTDQIMTPKMTSGDKIKNQTHDKNYLDLDPNETYTLIIYDVD